MPTPPAQEQPLPGCCSSLSEIKRALNQGLIESVRRGPIFTLLGLDWAAIPIPRTPLGRLILETY
jgi:hypothetical protein